MSVINRYIEVDNEFAVDLFPYKVKDVNSFYYRDHPENMNPRNFRYRTYWNSFLKCCLEGKWINDNGTWVFMMPKLFFYINYVIISDEDRDKINPRLRDNEWITFTYLLCSEGFSGFDGDMKYTCNKYVKKIMDGFKLQKYEQKALDADPFVKNEAGEYKEYVDPWVYLTETYLITDNQGKPLGRPIYSNGYYHIMIMAARGLSKSFCAFLGDFLHEWIFGNIRKWEDRKKVNNDALFGITSSVTKSLSRSVANLSRSYTQMPGQFNFPSSKKDQTVKYWGPFYKNIRGTWSVSQSGSNIQHILKSKKGGKELINGSQVNISLLGTNDFKPFAGDRFRRGYIEEVGFCGQIKKLFAASKDAFEVGKNQVGQMYMIGTSGDSTTIGDVKDMFDNPEAYNIFPIPNYWSKIEGKKCGLFLAAYYKAEEFKDNGNTNLAEALFDVIKNRELKKSQLDSVAFGMDIMWNPIYPKELLRPTHKSVIPVQELSEHREYLVINDINKKLSAVGALKYANNGSVKFVPDLGNTLSPILEWGRDKELEDTTGAWIIHEDRPSFIPDGLYYILYDPYTQSGEGTSLQSILVYKHKFKTTGNDESLQNTIVASYIGRYSDLDKSYEEAIKAAIYFNAKVFPELNSIGFAEYVLRKNYQYLMQRTPLNVLKSIKGSTYNSHSRSAYTFGLKVNEAMNIWSINKLANWLVDPVSVDPVTEIPTWRTYQNIRDLRLLSEAISFDFANKPDFDSMSALMLLPYLLSDLDDTTVEIPLEDDDDPYARYKEPEYIPKKVSKLSQTI